ncbi:Putative SKG6/AXL2 alpha-helix transmembrane domain-containing protein [Septoria linicola]|uniref:SKG6/AXL2 alpha-helix transmembrane domain-containing protein n=1 Tax=Septoria linicola TaxID=215465 RepID=A0A9Q9EF15_9PEZI|nr:Putative SKG6/AXL2 alpha-helix transmembrane domain-containing protein [Septoria linicola]
MSVTTAPTPVTGAARTNIGPLTTTFTAPQQCDVAFVDARPSALNSFFQAQTCNPVNAFWDIAEATVCWPPATYGVRPTNTPFHGWGFYSPGLVCPAGRTVACTATGGGSWGWPVQFSIYNDETAYGCCPTGYPCDQSGARAYQTCVSVVTSDGSYLRGDCTSGSLATQTYVTLPQTTTTAFPLVSVSTLISVGTLFAPMIELRRQPSDMPLTTASNTSTAAAAALATSTSTSSGLPTGAKIGIGVAVPVIVLAIVLAAFLLWRRRRKQSQDAAAPLIATKAPGQPYTDQPHNAAWAELDTSKQPSEMAAKTPLTYDRHELPTER